MPVTTDSWLGTWLGSEDIASMRQLDRALNYATVKERLWVAAAEVPYTTEPIPKLTGQTILAGKTLDFSGELDCCLELECRKKDIDKIFGKVWHYFDRIVLVGPSAAIVRAALERGDEDWALLKIKADAQLLFYLNDIGAEDMVLFREKPPACVEHMTEHSASLGIENIDVLIENEAARLRQDARIEIESHDDHFHYTLDHDSLEHRRWGTCSAAGSLELSACLDVAAEFAVHLTSDMRAARSLNLPLGTSAGLNAKMLSSIQRKLTASDVALSLELPVLEGISPKDLLALRQDEHESFDKFRTALRKAIEERLTYSTDKENIAEDIRRDIVDPSLNDISLRLRRAEESLRKKHRINIALGVLSVGCGLLRDPALASALMVATAVGAATVESKTVDDRRDISLSDMYFLWKAKEIGKSH